MVGTTSAVAPWAASAATMEVDCACVRGTSTRQPNSGRFSNQARRSRWAVPGPTTATRGSGRDSPASASTSETVPRVATTVRWAVVVPPEVTVTSRPSGRPAATEGLGGGDQGLAPAGEHHGARHGGQGVHAGGVQVDVEHVQVRGARRRGGHPDVKRHRHGARDARDHLVGQAGAPGGGHLLGQVRPAGPVAGEQPHHRATGPGRGGDQAGARGGGGGALGVDDHDVDVGARVGGRARRGR